MTGTEAASSVLVGVGEGAFGVWPLGISGAALDAAFRKISVSAFCLDASSFCFMLSWAKTSVRKIAFVAAWLACWTANSAVLNQSRRPRWLGPRLHLPSLLVSGKVPLECGHWGSVELLWMLPSARSPSRHSAWMPLPSASCSPGPRPPCARSPSWPLD